MDNFTSDLEKRPIVDDSRTTMSNFTSDLQPKLPPDMASKIDQFVGNPLFQIAAKAHVPEIQAYITENAGDYEELVYEYVRGKYPAIYNLINQGRNSAGLTNSPPYNSNILVNSENSVNGEFEPDNDLSKEDWDEVLESMSKMSDDGFAPGKISRIIEDDYGIVMSHQQVRMSIDRYKRSKKAQELEEAQEKAEQEKIEQARSEQILSAQKKVLTLSENYEKVRAEKCELEKKIAVYEALEKAKCPPVEVKVEEQIGVLRKIKRWLY